MANDAIELGALDLEEQYDDDVRAQILCEPSELLRFRNEMESRGHSVRSFQLTFVPITRIAVSCGGEQALLIEKAVQSLESLDDVIDVYYNVDFIE